VKVDWQKKTFEIQAEEVEVLAKLAVSMLRQEPPVRRDSSDNKFLIVFGGIMLAFFALCMVL